MPGFGNQTGESGNARYANIISGSFAEKVDEGTSNAKSRVNKNDETVWELYHPSIEGYIKKCYIKETDFGKTLCIVFDCEESGTIVANVPVESRYFDSLMLRLPNIPLDAMVTVKPYSFIDKETKGKRQGLSITVNGVKIEPFYTKENPGKKPTDKQYKKLPDGKLKEADFKHFKATEREWFCELIEQVFPEGENPKYNSKPPMGKPVEEVDPDLSF